VGLVQNLPGILAVWAEVDRGRLCISTQVAPDDDSTEQAVYQAELELMDKWAEPPVTFRVSRSPDFAESMAGVEPLLTTEQ
jgi:hypothetical protein